MRSNQSVPNTTEAKSIAFYRTFWSRSSCCNLFSKAKIPCSTLLPLEPFSKEHLGAIDSSLQYFQSAGGPAFRIRTSYGSPAQPRLSRLICIQNLTSNQNTEALRRVVASSSRTQRSVRRAPGSPGAGRLS